MCPISSLIYRLAHMQYSDDDHEIKEGIFYRSTGEWQYVHASKIELKPAMEPKTWPSKDTEPPFDLDPNFSSKISSVHQVLALNVTISHHSKGSDSLTFDLAGLPFEILLFIS